MNATKKPGKKNRKIDRNRPWCEAYRNRGQREINKAKKLKKHILRHPEDLCATRALVGISEIGRAA